MQERKQKNDAHARPRGKPPQTKNNNWRHLLNQIQGHHLQQLLLAVMGLHALWSALFLKMAIWAPMSPPFTPIFHYFPICPPLSRARDVIGNDSGRRNGNPPLQRNLPMSFSPWNFHMFLIFFFDNSPLQRTFRWFLLVYGIVKIQLKRGTGHWQTSQTPAQFFKKIGGVQKVHVTIRRIHQMIMFGPLAGLFHTYIFFIQLPMV